MSTLDSINITETSSNYCSIAGLALIVLILLNQKSDNIMSLIQTLFKNDVFRIVILAIIIIAALKKATTVAIIGLILFLVISHLMVIRSMKENFAYGGALNDLKNLTKIKHKNNELIN
jgi:hypothetical protein